MPAVCPVCKQHDHTTLLLNKDGYDLYDCTLCHHIFVWPVPPIVELKRVYSFANAYQVQSRTIFDDSTAISDKTRESLRQIEYFCRRRSRLLDVGCSSGKFLWLAKRHGWSSVYGVELNEDTAQIAKDNGLCISVGELASANYSPSSFDAIHVGDVIEHVRDPEETLSELFSLLSPDGVILFVTPNHDAIFPVITLWLYRLFSIPWSHPTPPYHLNQFSEKSLLKLLQNVNLEVIHRQYRGCDLRYELGETHVLRFFRQALRERRRFQAAKRLLIAAVTAVAYTVVYAIDRCCAWKTRDFEMLVVAKKAAHCSEEATAVLCLDNSTQNLL